MRRILAGLALALLIASPVYGKAGASITAPDGLAFGDSFTPTYVAPNHYAGGLFVHLFCLANETSVGTAVVQESWASVGSPFTLGPTPSWAGGGADCTVTLQSHNGGKVTDYASDAFIVAP